VVLLILVLLIAGNLKKLRNETVMLMVVVAVIIQGVFLTAVYVKEFEKVTQKSISAVAAYLSSSIESVLDKGISLDEISDLEEYLDSKRQENDFIKNITK
jgi:nucleoside permease NupC